ncbi:MAG: cytochrome c oxidase subunit II [Fibrobacteres bacterium]|nr:cytochrome c oxidase subunit II [Fibrobacterota bacterium]
MRNTFFSLPQASAIAGKVDGLFLFLIGLTGLILLGISSAIVFLSWRYHKSREPDRSAPPPSHLLLEAAWTGIPLAVCAVIFIWGTKLYLDMHPLRGKARDVYVVGMQWMWKVQHPQGPREINSLHVPVGERIRLVLTSEDVIHSFYVPAFRIKQDAVPGMYTSLDFQAVRPGTYHLFCAEYCGSPHHSMGGEVVVMEPAAFEHWLATGGDRGPGASETLAQRGAAIFRAQGCSGCHGVSPTVRAPALEGLYGRSVPLQEGGLVLADEAYLRESIYFPQRKIAAGYAPVMPSFQGRINEEDMLALIAYLRSLGDARKNGEIQ